jgi:hypothetical protein
MNCCLPSAEATWAEVIVGVDPDPEKRECITTWAKKYWDALHPHSAGGSYVNFMMDEGENRGEGQLPRQLR